jgi:hypothetical protein
LPIIIAASAPLPWVRKGPRVDRRFLVRHDLDRVEHLAQTRLRQLAFLVQQIALGDQDQRVAFRNARTVSSASGSNSIGWASISCPAARISAMTEAAHGPL